MFSSFPSIPIISIVYKGLMDVLEILIYAYNNLKEWTIIDL